MDTFVRSLFVFYDSKKPVSRTKNKSTEKDFDIILNSILVKEDLITVAQSLFTGQI